LQGLNVPHVPLGQNYDTKIIFIEIQNNESKTKVREIEIDKKSNALLLNQLKHCSFYNIF